MKLQGWTEQKNKTGTHINAHSEQQYVLKLCNPWLHQSLPRRINWFWLKDDEWVYTWSIIFYPLHDLYIKTNQMIKAREFLIVFPCFSLITLFTYSLILDSLREPFPPIYISLKQSFQLNHYSIIFLKLHLLILFSFIFKSTVKLNVLEFISVLNLSVLSKPFHLLFFSSSTW